MSAFVKKGAVRIASSKFTSKLDTVSFENPDGSVCKEFYRYFNEKLKFILDKVERMWYYMYIIGGDCICLQKRGNIKYI